MKVNVRPGEERIALIQDKAEEMTSAGLEIPTDARKPPTTGVIVAVGPASAAEPGRMDQFAEGDRVAFDQFAGSAITVGGQQLLFINALDVVAVIGEAE